MKLTDTHCHIHESSYYDSDAAYQRSLDAGVTRLICVGTDEVTSAEAADFAGKHDNTWFSVGLHPHDATSGAKAVEHLKQIIIDKNVHVNKCVAVGECGLDYFYDNSPRETQLEMLHAQIRLALSHNLPMIFHVREAFDDFWSVFDSYQGVRGVIHSFTDSTQNMQMAIDRGLYIGVNGIATFARDPAQQAMYASIPLENMLLETDAPFLTPVPNRGKINEPAFITHVAQHIANLQSINLEELSRATERNATTLFFNTNN